MPGLTDNEVRAIAYFAIGVSSEGGDQAYRLAFAGNTTRDAHGHPELHPIANSGYSVGTLQSDLGQSGGTVATRLVDAFQRWAQTEHTTWVLDSSLRTGVIADLSRNGRQIRLDHGRDLDPAVKSHLQRFLASDAGVSWVHGRDVEQIDRLMSDVAAPLRTSKLYLNASVEDQARLVAIAAKAYNQSERWGRGILDNINGGAYQSVSDVSAAVDRMPDYMRSGRDAALHGVDLFNALQQAGTANAMGTAWQHVLSDPLIDPTRLRAEVHLPQLAHEYPAIKDAFVDPKHGQRFVEALAHGGSYSYGNPANANSRGFHVEGCDFVEWNRAGVGRAFLDNRWREVSRDDLARMVNPDHSIDLRLRSANMDEALLHITHPGSSHGRLEAARDRGQDPGTLRTLREHDRGAQVRSLQTWLDALGYGGGQLALDGNFGHRTRLALEAFQRNHALVVDGVAGRRTFAVLQQSMLAREASQLTHPAHPGYGLYCQALEGVHKLDAHQGRTPDQLSVNLAGSLAVAAKHKGLGRIEHVVLSGDHIRAFAVQGDLASPFKRYADVAIVPAVQATIQQSSERWPQRAVQAVDCGAQGVVQLQGCPQVLPR